MTKMNLFSQFLPVQGVEARFNSKILLASFSLLQFVAKVDSLYQAHPDH